MIDNIYNLMIEYFYLQCGNVLNVTKLNLKPAQSETFKY